MSEPNEKEVFSKLPDLAPPPVKQTVPAVRPSSLPPGLIPKPEPLPTEKPKAPEKEVLPAEPNPTPPKKPKFSLPRLSDISKLSNKQLVIVVFATTLLLLIGLILAYSNL